jgi:hypothetical protein
VIAFLETLINIVTAFGSLVAWGAITALNGFFHALELAVKFLFGLLPTMPSFPIFAPSWLPWANWFFPFGLFVAAFAAVLVVYLLFIIQRWLLKLIRAL